MGVTNYFSANGMLLGEDGPNGKVGYLTDALGSVTSTLNQAGAVLNTYRYKPYGSQLSRTGTAPDPKFTWVGSQGYRQTGTGYSDAYIRARHFSTVPGSWASMDPMWPSQQHYTYCSGNPSSRTDMSGLIGCLGIMMGADCKVRKFTPTVVWTRCVARPLPGRRLSILATKSVNFFSYITWTSPIPCCCSFAQQLTGYEQSTYFDGSLSDKQDLLPGSSTGWVPDGSPECSSGGGDGFLEIWGADSPGWGNTSCNRATCQDCSKCVTAKVFDFGYRDQLDYHARFRTCVTCASGQKKCVHWHLDIVIKWPSGGSPSCALS